MNISEYLRDKKIKIGKHPNSTPRGEIREYRLRAVNALGKPLPEDVSVHHHDEEQLVICENEAYHRLIHARERAYLATGDAHKRTCTICHEWDDPENLSYVNASKSMRHKKCHADREYLRGLEKPKKRQVERRKYGYTEIVLKTRRQT